MAISYPSLLRRKIRSLFVIATQEILRRKNLIRIGFWNDNIELPTTSDVRRNVSITALDGGRIKVGKFVTFHAESLVLAVHGIIEIGDNVHIGKGSVLVARACIKVGDNTQIAEYVTIRDQDHDFDHFDIITQSGFKVNPVSIGADVWIGAKATVLRGASIGDHAVVGAHSLVKGVVPSGAVVVGTPARVVSYRGAVGPRSIL